MVTLMVALMVTLLVTLMVTPKITPRVPKTPLLQRMHLYTTTAPPPEFKEIRSQNEHGVNKNSEC